MESIKQLNSNKMFAKNNYDIKYKSNSPEIHKYSTNSNNILEKNKVKEYELENSWIEEFDQNININNTVNLINNSLK